MQNSAEFIDFFLSYRIETTKNREPFRVSFFVVADFLNYVL